MNLILPDEINFYDELNKLDSDNDNDNDDNICLLTKLPLDKNKITLTCGHSFNFEPLFKEVCVQKCRTFTSHLEINKLEYNEIKCPYCRQKQNKLLPYVKLNNKMTYITGVNSPINLCMEFYNCGYIFKSGKNIGDVCCKPAYHAISGCYCNYHHTIISKKQNIPNKQCNICCVILQSGKRKGMACGVKIYNIDVIYCKRHSKL